MDTNMQTHGLLWDTQSLLHGRGHPERCHKRNTWQYTDADLGHTRRPLTDDTWNFAALHILRVALNLLFHTFQRLIHYPYKHNWSYWLSAWVTPQIPNSSQIRDRRALWTSSITSSSQKNCPNSLLRQNSIWTHIHTSKERVSWVSGLKLFRF